MASVPILTGTHLRLLSEGLGLLWGHEYEQYPVEWKPVFMSKKSSKAFEDMQGIYGLALAPERQEADGFLYDSGGQGFAHRLTNVEYGIGVAISQAAIEDNLYIDLSSMYTKEIMKALNETDENLAAGIINRATTSGNNGADGVVLASASHVYMGGGTYTNLITAAALSEASLEDQLIVIRKYKDERQLPRALSGQKVVIPPDLEFNIARILKSVQQNDTQLNAINAIKVNGKLPSGWHVMTRLSSTTAHFIQTNAPQGLLMFDRVSPSFKMDMDFKTYNLLLQGRSRRVFGWLDPHGICYNGGA